MPDTDHSVDIRMLTRIADIPAADWDACACPETADGGRPDDPFTTHRFLHALEMSGSVGAGTGWQAHHLLAERSGVPIGVMPLYAKGHSQGEYIFDHAFANAWQRAGGRYYPKLQSAVPFTPATGRRLLVRPDEADLARRALLQGMVQIASDSRLSSAHVTFCTGQEAALGAEMGFLHRVTQQFHWENRGYGSFDDFLADLSSRKRKTIRKERATAHSFGGEIVALTGDAIEPAHWEAFWDFYQDTGARKWGTPYLTRRFFDIAHETMRADMLLVLAMRGGRPVAGALNFIGRETLFGRYWGCIEDHPCMHFELCYYRAIDWAVAQGMARVEAGAQGEHKLARGYMPSQVHSLHWFADAGFRDAVARYIDQERDAVDQEMEILADFGPFRKPARQEAT
jgi:hypothetical protein